jgi:hypothetical protein
LVQNEREKLEVLARLLSLHMARLLAPAYYRPEINKKNDSLNIEGALRRNVFNILAIFSIVEIKIFITSV